MAEKCATASDLALALGNFDLAVSCLHSQQTLAAGLIAIMAALIGAAVVMLQIRQTDRMERKRRDQKWAAARIKIPLLVEHLEKYLIDCEEWLLDLFDETYNTKNAFTEKTAPPVPETPTVLLEKIEYLTDDVGEQERAMITGVISELTLLRKRLSVEHSRSNENTNIAHPEHRHTFRYDYMRHLFDCGILGASLNMLKTCCYTNKFTEKQSLFVNDIPKLRWSNVREYVFDLKKQNILQVRYQSSPEKLKYIKDSLLQRLSYVTKEYRDNVHMGAF